MFIYLFLNGYPAYRNWLPFDYNVIVKSDLHQATITGVKHMSVEKISIEQAADILATTQVVKVIRHGAMTASLVSLEDGQAMTLVQAGGEDFLLVRHN